jgi:hypothetical protein
MGECISRDDGGDLDEWPGDDVLGDFMVAYEELPVTETVLRNSNQVKLLYYGEHVTLLEIAAKPQDGRIRARIESPVAGWITTTCFGEPFLGYLPKKSAEPMPIVAGQQGGVATRSLLKGISKQQLADCPDFEVQLGPLVAGHSTKQTIPNCCGGCFCFKKKPIVPERKATLGVGDSVQATTKFMTNCHLPVQICEGVRGRVFQLDEDGDALIKFEGIDQRKWVLQDNLHILTKIKVGKVVIIKLKADDYEGSTGRILEDDERAMSHKVELQDGTTRWYRKQDVEQAPDVGDCVVAIPGSNHTTEDGEELYSGGDRGRVLDLDHNRVHIAWERTQHDSFIRVPSFKKKFKVDAAEAYA